MSDKNFMSYGDAESLFAELGSELGKRVEQYSTMPSASSTLLNKIVQYIGTTSESYTNGFFYKCVYNEIEADYEWIKIDMDGGSGIAITATLLASGWDANNQQTIIFDGYRSSMNGVIGVPASATSAQKTAYTEAIINVVNQVGKNFTFEATNVPSIDLPVVVYAGGGSGSGGTNVEPNPIGTPIDELVTIRIEDDIYSLAGGCEAIEKTQAQYNALTQAEKLDPKKVYYITDAGGSGGSGASALSELTDVELTDLADGEILKYDATEEKWVNAEDGGSGGGSVVANSMPDYTNIETKQPSELPLVMPYDGYVMLVAYRYQVRINIDGNAAAAIYGYSTDISISDLVPCKKGSIITLDWSASLGSGSAWNIRLVPLAYGGGSFCPIIYSLEEREIGVWTDGKPLYQRTLVINTISSSTGVQRFAHNIANIDVAFAVSGTWLQKSDNSIYIGTKDIIRTDGSGNYNVGRSSVGAWVDATNITIDTADDRSSQYLVITIQYTKTTDVAGSGSYAELGVPAVHYDNTERVIGTWFGETLYRRSFVLTTAVILSSSEWTYCDITFPSQVEIRKGYVYRHGNHGVFNPSGFNCRTDNHKVGFRSPIQVDLDVGSIVTLEYTKTS